MADPIAEVDVTPELVTALLAEQHRDLARLDVTHLARGWDNDIYRLGDAFTVRLPRRAAAAALTLHEQRWLPVIAGDLPLPVPVPVRTGVPGCGYPWAWSVCPWLPGVEIERAHLEDWTDAAQRLGQFLAAMHRPAPLDAPTNPYRGVPLADRAERFLEGVDLLGSRVERSALLEAWEVAAAADPWTLPPVWIHGDVHPLNVLVDNGRVASVIDFGDLAAGDPASDLAIAWMLFPAATRPAFRAACGDRRPVDDALWTRAWGWALALGVALAGGDERVAAIGRRTIAAVLADP